MVFVQNELPFEYEQLICRAVEYALQKHRKSGDVNVLITDYDHIHELNRTFRNVDAPTDVLTFPADPNEQMFYQNDDFLGDIAICLPRAKEQAVDYGHSLERELAFLAIHGTLHILGYDHIQPDEERVMIEKQKEILGELGIAR